MFPLVINISFFCPIPSINCLCGLDIVGLANVFINVSNVILFFLILNNVTILSPLLYVLKLQIAIEQNRTLLILISGITPSPLRTTTLATVSFSPTQNTWFFNIIFQCMTWVGLEKMGVTWGRERVREGMGREEEVSWEGNGDIDELAC